jgi:hypothetical protein
VIHNGDHARGNDHNWKCRKSAAHYTIDRDGSIYQHIGEERAAWHAGSVNHRSIGIELQIQRGYGSSCNSLTGRALARAAEREGRSEGDIVRELCAPTLSQYLALQARVVASYLPNRRLAHVPANHQLGNAGPAAHLPDVLIDACCI